MLADRHNGLTAVCAALVVLGLATRSWCQEAEGKQGDGEAKRPAMTVEEAIAGLNAPKALTQEQATITLYEAGPRAKDAVPVIIEILNREWPEVRTELLHVLFAIGPDAKDAVPTLIKVSGNFNFHARYLACRVLGRLGEAARPAVPTLIERLGEEVTSVRRNAAWALGALGPDVAPEAVEPLLRTLDDPLAPVREQAVVALGNFGRLGDPAVPRLIAIARDPNSSHRSAACGSLWRLTGDADLVLPILREVLREGNLEWEPAQVLAEMGPAAKSAVPDLIEALSKDETAQIFAAEALGSIGPDARTAIEALRKLLENEEPEVREVAKKAIQRIEQKPEP
jgi:HEAT repeat protein